ncbi:hypothetical protein PBRA_002210 [Plasmodiophora brassicae]|uniref:Uncharacterized protein n=1 Tax=Plasmodiophora brassicae TaxID=37360 RepID=A0A0G4J2Z6_PLABS|nr:hypothetical protein PBRA_002210 [Plasmodiophora brassicae]
MEKALNEEHSGWKMENYADLAKNYYYVGKRQEAIHVRPCISGDDAHTVASWITNHIPCTNAQCIGSSDRNLSARHGTVQYIAQAHHRLAHSGAAFSRADTGVGIDCVVFELNDYAQLTAPHAREEDRLDGCRTRNRPDVLTDRAPGTLDGRPRHKDEENYHARAAVEAVERVINDPAPAEFLGVVSGRTL